MSVVEHIISGLKWSWYPVGNGLLKTVHVFHEGEWRSDWMNTPLIQSQVTPKPIWRLDHSIAMVNLSAAR
ncbi:hypothetical protein [Echinicola rosea]|uniref:hypothetical protein n=1 Tax=Echinicola rosea TaxID=1807691 RepID=UPI0010CA7E86|nr:hypothetical protein [Echinicola rosea]